MAQGLQRAVNAARATRGQPPLRVHLIDPAFGDLNRTFCGHAGPAFSAPITTDPNEATCKTCLRAHRRVTAHANAEAMARESLMRG